MLHLMGVCINFLEYQEANADIVKEVSRVLKAGGRAVIITLSPKTPWALKQVASMLRPGNTLKAFKPLSEKDLSALTTGTDLKIEKTVKLAKYSPIQFGKSLYLG